MSRIALHDNLMDALSKMCEGNPGALRVLIQLVDKTEEMDTAEGYEPFDSIHRLDLLGIYGSSIWILYKDICKEDIVKMIKLLHATKDEKISRLDVNKSVLCCFPTETVKHFLSNI